jgi:hypothetical protein
MKLKYALPFICLAMSSGAAFATCTQPSGSYGGASGGTGWYNGQQLGVNAGVTVLSFTSPTQGTLLQLVRSEFANNPLVPPAYVITGNFVLASGGYGWIPAYCSGELTVTWTNPPVPGPITQTFAYTSTNSGAVLSLVAISGTYSGGLTDGIVTTNSLRLEKQ